MSDFFNNLLQRSAVDPSMTVSLRPRLPSLFEPLHGADKFPVPAADSLERKSASPLVVPDSPEMLQTKMPSAPSTIRVDYGPFPILQENQPRTRPHDPALSPQQETPLNTRPKTQAEKLEMAKEISRSEPLPVQVQKAPELVFPQEQIKTVLETIIKPVKEDSFVPENVVTAHKEPPKTQTDPTTALRPLILAPRLTERPRLESPQQQEQPRVVEIHIGRIEVRAMTTPVTPPTKPRSTSVMTLDEYLQRRNIRDH